MNGGLSSWLVKEKFSYPGWEDDYEIAREAYDEDMPGVSADFQNAVHRLNEKQRIFEGDRSHPRLVALDQLSLNYPCWEDDVKNCEEAHFNNYYDATKEDVYFQSKLEGLQNRQQLYYGYNCHGRSQTRPEAASAQEITAMLGPCVICGERDKTHLFDPCGHLCACQSCANNVMRLSDGASSCPVCRVPCHKVIRVYFT